MNSLVVDRPVWPRPYRLHSEIQPYEWGTRDGEAFIPRLLGIEPEPGRPYAELWIGAHPKAPSIVELNGELVPLDCWIAVHPLEILGRNAVQRFGPRLPFLLKVLSAGEPLSIQAHPNKAQAEVLHARFPQHYPDDNHKPEIAVALDSLTALAGIRPIAGSLEAIDQYPELATFLGREVCSHFRDEQAAAPKERAQGLFTGLLRRSITHAQTMQDCLDRLAQRLRAAPIPLAEREALFLALREKYEGADPGLFAIFLLNLVHIQKGQAIFTQAGVPHAYLKGNIVECMANSDNVVRVGLTSKFKDAETLIEILDAEPRPAQVIQADTGPGLARYPVLSQEFGLSRLRLGPGLRESWLEGGRLIFLLVTHGQVTLTWSEATRLAAQDMRTGQAILLPAILDRCHLGARDSAEVFLAEVPD